MEQHDIEIRIAKGGKVRLHVRGPKGERCLSYLDLFEQIVGPVEERQYTHEFFEREGRVKVDVESVQRVHEAEP